MEELKIKDNLKKFLFIRGFVLTNKNLDLKVFPFYNNWEKTELNH